MKVRFRSVAIVFGASFIVFSGVLLKYMFAGKLFMIIATLVTQEKKLYLI